MLKTLYYVDFLLLFKYYSDFNVYSFGEFFKEVKKEYLNKYKDKKF